ncbi:MAG: efflux RND transporter permease subunit [Geobacteraceae bacterium]|nr:efflux RND transporter permease subunit [Geobacteraceae bacterium]
MNPIKLSLRYPTVTVILTVLLVLVGLRAFFTMPRTEDPTITIRTGLVIALYPGATSEQVEKQVTKTLEKHIFKFSEVRKGKTFSTSRPGLAVINVELEDHVKNTDLFWSKLRHELNETRAIELPEGVRGPIVNSDFGDTVAMLIAVHGKRYGYRELRDYTDRIQDELRTIRDVGKLATYGGQSEEVWITSSLARVSQYFANPLQVAQALQQRNVIEGSGKFETDNAGIPMRTTGIFTTEDQIRNVLVDVSKTGQPVYIRDFANVERRYQDPTFLVRHDGEPSILISVEMQKDKNIVQLGEQIDQVFTRLKTILPPDIQLDLVANQPHVVKDRMSSLSHEFMLAIIAVVLVAMLLLPIRVAVVAALAIPVTLCATLGIMNALGIALHQVSIAALIVVLGIMVDDAIVIADNYVELLDQKVPRMEAAWRSATDVVVPVFTATVTIVCSFLPLLIISGSVGEFVAALPVTVAIALTVSFIVAVMLTPILCRFFIKKGLHDHENGESEEAKKKFNVLDRLQGSYQVLICWFMGRKRFAVLVGVVAFVAGIALFTTVREQFFPSAERNQFVIDVWMPQGTRIESTDAVMARIEKRLAGKKDAVHYATFVGQSAPRFYYNVNPQQPDPAYGQFIVNTKSVEATSRLVAELRPELAQLAPEALVIVKELQQGEQMEAPVEVRISGDDIAELKHLGSQVEAILSSVPFSTYVHQDFFNDSCLLDVNIDNELANRLGITNSSVSGLLQGAFDGGPVSTFWEGDRPVTIMLRLDRESRSSFSDIRNSYMTSQLTNARVPLRSIATLEPEWQTSRIVRRNGMRTITVRGFVKQGWYGSDLLKEARPRIEALRLPLGYRLEYGGEKMNSDETLPDMMVALGISLLAIFLVLLVQFRTIAEPLVIMASIPLALPGAALGLVITHNPFGFTAFLGMISLTGIVVRNAIILVDYIREKLAEGQTLEQAATEAGARRLRPIFLTSMAAAVGVTPMILSGSSLWSPLASVIAVGLICSMFFTLLVVPVLYVLVMSRTSKSGRQGLVVAALLLLVGAGQAAAGQLNITLPEAIDLARQQNSALKISNQKIEENRQRIVSARSKYFPQLSNESSYLALSDKQLVTIPAGSLGTVPGLGPFPTQDTKIDQGSNALFISSTTLSQPLTQLFKIHEGHEVAKAESAIAESDARKTECEIVYAVQQLYYGLLVARKQIIAAQAQLAAAREGLRESEDAVRAGNQLQVAVTGSRVQFLQGRQAQVAAEIQAADFTLELNDLLGLPLDTELVPAELDNPPPAPDALPEYLRRALAHNPELESARRAVTKARHGVKAARDEYIPDISLIARHVYQDGSPFISNNIGIFGVQMTWNLFDWGNRQGLVGQRKSQLTQAEENLKRIEQRISVDVTKAYRKLEQTTTLLDVASEALNLQRENQRLTAALVKAGTATAARQAEAVAAVGKAELDELQATLGYRLALADLDRISGGIAPSGRR